VEINISCNGDKGVANYIMGSNAFIVMNTTYEVDTHRVNGMCAHTSKMLAIEGWGSPSQVQCCEKKLGKVIQRLGRLVEL
jgi:hypothetical protein